MRHPHLLRLVRAADDAGAKLIAVGDDRQIPSVDAGGLFTALTKRLGVFELTINHRFADLRQRDAAEQLRDRNPDTAITTYQQLGLLQVHPTVAACHEAMLADWLNLTEQCQAARMLADINKVVAELNIQARHHLRNRGVVAKGGHAYHDRDTRRRIRLAAGDQVRLGRNDARLHCPDGRRIEVRNGMQGHVMRTTRTRVEVQLDPEHIADGQPDRLVLPASYVAADVDYAYALTCNKAKAPPSTTPCTTPPTGPAPNAPTSPSHAAGSATASTPSNAPVREHALGATRTHTPATDQHPEPQTAQRLCDQHDGRTRRQDEDPGRPITM